MVAAERLKPMEAVLRGNQETSELRAKLTDAIEKAKELCKRLQDQTAAAAKATDRTVRDHPYQAIGVAVTLGLITGLILARSRRRS
jgi:ElaB/YqjD/DUF883 family membrane-anchored ribosome-binding protein